jgi:hypothetical protein
VGVEVGRGRTRGRWWLRSQQGSRCCIARVSSQWCVRGACVRVPSRPARGAPRRGRGRTAHAWDMGHGRTKGWQHAWRGGRGGVVQGGVSVWSGHAHGAGRRDGARTAKQPARARAARSSQAWVLMTTCWIFLCWAGVGVSIHVAACVGIASRGVGCRRGLSFMLLQD